MDGNTPENNLCLLCDTPVTTDYNCLWLNKISPTPIFAPAERYLPTLAAQVGDLSALLSVYSSFGLSLLETEDYVTQDQRLRSNRKHFGGSLASRNQVYSFLEYLKPQLV